jgi:hypothetical protein
MSGAMMAMMNNNVASATGPTPGSIYFPTNSSRVTLTPGIVVGGTYQSPFTVQGWFYSGDTPGTDFGPVILSTDTASSTPAYAKALTINVLSTTQIVVDSNGATSRTFDLAQTLIANAWYYVAVSRDTSGFLQVWLGKQGDASAAASTSGRFDCNADTSGWALTGLSNCIGAFVPAGRYSATDYISGIRVTNTNLFTTTDATIPMPTQTFEGVSGTLFLQSPTDLSDLTGNQTLTSVGSAAYSATGPSIAIQTYTPVYTSLAGSLQFNGSSQYLSMSPGFALGSGAYTIEGWFYNNSTYATQKGLVATDQTGALSLFNTDAQSFTLDKYGGLGARTYTFPTNTLQVNKWQYIILNRNASTQVETMWVGTFVDTSSYVTCSRATAAAGGTSVSGGTQVNNLDYTGVCNWIGRFYGGYWPGFITNLRVTVGMSVYNSTSATVTAPSVPLSSWANTRYLMLGAAVTTDTSGVQTVTNNGIVTQSATKPF